MYIICHGYNYVIVILSCNRFYNDSHAKKVWTLLWMQEWCFAHCSIIEMKPDQ